MESLLANYASSEDEEEQQQQQKSRGDSSYKRTSASSQPNETPKISQTFSSLPKPKSSSSSVFSSLPNPKSNQKFPTISGSNPKRVIQFKPPVNPSLIKPFDDDEDDEEEDNKRKPIKESIPSSTGGAKSLFSFLPAPKNSGGLGSGAGFGAGGRRSVVVEPDAAEVPTSDGTQLGKNEIGNGEDLGNSGHYAGNWVDEPSSTTSEGLITGGDSTNWVGSNQSSHGSYDGYYGNYEGSYGYGYYDGSTALVAPDGSGAGGGVVESVPRIPGKRGRDEIPMEIVEVKQDELMKNRPREDQVKMTGIAFGPAYQPVSTKGKPSKLHKRKHQIGSLLYDMKQREMELAERRSKGLLTKAETQAKYGW